MLETQEILAAINNEFNSKKYQLARKGLRYYEGRHDIEDYKIYYIDADGNVLITYVGALAFGGSGGGCFRYNIKDGSVDNITPMDKVENNVY